MDTEKDNKKGIREMLQGYEIQPSASVWERIGAASPVPVAPPRIIRPWVYGAAAFLIVAGIILFLIPSGQPDVADMDQIEILVPEISYDMQETDNTDVASSREVAAVAANAPLNTEQGVVIPEIHQPTKVADAFMPDQMPVALPSEKKPEKETPTKTTEPVKTVSTLPSQTPSTPKPSVQPEVIVSKENQKSSPDNTPEPKGKLKVYIPNAFAPNSDGTNDIFRPVIKDNAEVTDYMMQIYTRSGVLLFESNNIANGWDGRFKGVPVDDQICVYVISFRDMEGFPYRNWGTVVIVK